MIHLPYTIKNITLQNRLVLSPMCMYQANNGFANDFHLVHYGKYALANIGLLIMEATAVSPEGRITPKCLGIWDDAHIEKLSRITKFVHDQGESKIGIQLAHAGRKASTMDGKTLSIDQGGWQTVAPSPIPYKPDEKLPQEMSRKDIENVVRAFAKAADRAVKAGFDLIEIHAAHGYLLHQFLSPLSNYRTDMYGGSLENRARFLMEVVQAIRENTPENMPLFVRISAQEYAENGWDLEQSISLSTMLKKAGVDLIDVSSGGNIHKAKISVFEGYQVPFSEAIKRECNIPTGAVGKITSIVQANKILSENKADLIMMARSLLKNPMLYFQSLPCDIAAEKVAKSYIRAVGEF